MAALRTFSLAGCTLTYGPIIVTGFAADDVFTVEPSGPDFTEVLGADGDLSMAQNSVYYKCKVSLAQTSKTNDAFSAALKLDRISGAGVMPLTFKDSRGASTTILTASRIMGEPSAAYGTTIKNREWNIVGIGENFVGGN
jgi:hypothetical protein